MDPRTGLKASKRRKRFTLPGFEPRQSGPSRFNVRYRDLNRCPSPLELVLQGSVRHHFLQTLSNMQQIRVPCITVELCLSLVNTPAVMMPVQRRCYGVDSVTMVTSESRREAAWARYVCVRAASGIC
jgi:hypothetical protein